MDDKIKHTENSTDKIKETLGREIQKTKKSNNDTKSKLRVLGEIGEAR